LIEGSRVSFLWRCHEVFLLILWWPTTIGINNVHWLGVTTLVVFVMRGPWGFVCP
jgi:hypothetical protein